MDLLPVLVTETPEVVIINKPSGLQVHPARIHVHKKAPSPSTAALLLTDWILRHYPEMREVGDYPGADNDRPGIVHRLDKETSGIMILARTQEAFQSLKRQFQEHTIHKTYLAVVRGIPRQNQGRIDAAIGISNGTLKRSVRATKLRKEAVTEYRVIRQFATAALLELRPLTGRTHQLRVHLAYIGHPIVGDVLYGEKKQPLWAPRTLLHAGKLEFSLPSSNVRTLVEAPLPADFQSALAVLEGGGVK